MERACSEARSEHEKKQQFVASVKALKDEAEGVGSEHFEKILEAALQKAKQAKKTLEARS